MCFADVCGGIVTTSASQKIIFTLTCYATSNIPLELTGLFAEPCNFALKNGLSLTVINNIFILHITSQY